MNVSPLEHMAVPLNFRHMAHHVCNELHHERNLVLKSNLHRHPVVCDDRFQLTSFRVGFVATELLAEVANSIVFGARGALVRRRAFEESEIPGKKKEINRKGRQRLSASSCK